MSEWIKRIYSGYLAENVVNGYMRRKRNVSFMKNIIRIAKAVSDKKLLEALHNLFVMITVDKWKLREEFFDNLCMITDFSEINKEYKEQIVHTITDWRHKYAVSYDKKKKKLYDKL